MKPKYLYYYCVDCKISWTDVYEEQYGMVDAKCPECGHDHTPFDNKSQWLKAVKK